MMDDPWLSILIPVFNVELYLRECVESVLAQADERVEVVLLDDCSTDGSAALMHALQSEWPGRLALMAHERNGGLSAARNTMLAAAKGRYLWFLDSDDKLVPGAVPELSAIVSRHDPDLVLCDFKMWRHPTRLKHRLRGELHRRTFRGPARSLLTDRSALVEGMFGPGHMHIWSKISKRHLWSDGLRFPEGQFFEDMPVTGRLALKARSYYYQDSVWVAYRQRAGSILSSMTPAKASDLSRALLGYRQEVLRCDPPISEAARFSVDYCVARNFICVARYADQAGTPEVAKLGFQARVEFEESITAGVDELRRNYWRHGWLWRWRRLAFWLRAFSPSAAAVAGAAQEREVLPPLRTAHVEGPATPERNACAETPKIIWSFWCDTPAPRLAERCVQGWRRLHPAYQVELVHEENVQRFVPPTQWPKGFSSWSKARKADWLRLALVARYGGFWLDSSILLTRPVDWMISSEAVSGSGKGQFTGFYRDSGTVRPRYPFIETWAFAAPAGNSFIKEWCGCLTDIFETGETAFIERLRNEGVHERVVGGLQDPRRAISQVAAAYVLHVHGPFAMHLIAADADARPGHDRGRWKSLGLLWSLLFRETRVPLVPMIRLDRKEQQRLEACLRMGLMRPTGLAARLLGNVSSASSGSQEG